MIENEGEPLGSSVGRWLPMQKIQKGEKRYKAEINIRMQAQIVSDNVSQGLCVGSRSRSATEDAIVKLSKLVSDSVCDIRAHCGS